MKTKQPTVIASAARQSQKIKPQIMRLLACRTGKFRHSNLIPRNDLYKKLFFLFSVLFTINSFSQETNYKEYSYTEFFKMIEEEKDTIFKLENALIQFNPATDQRHILKRNENGTILTPTDSLYKPIIIDKTIELNNVHFIDYENGSERPYAFNSGLINITFLKKLTLYNTNILGISNCEFKDDFTFRHSRVFDETEINHIINGKSQMPKVIIGSNTFFGAVNIHLLSDANHTSWTNINRNDFLAKGKSKSLSITTNTLTRSLFFGNKFFSEGLKRLGFFYTQDVAISQNQFKNGILQLNWQYCNTQQFTNNEIDEPVLLDIDMNKETEIAINQFTKSINSYSGYTEFLRDRNESSDSINHYKALVAYEKEFKIQNEIAFNHEVEQISRFYTYYKNKYNTKTANDYYIKLKDLETQRLNYMYRTDPSFDTYFTWKTNQFLKVFSDYGTRPSKAIVMSVYVILLFALIYLLFPNSWDSHGKRRIMDRYRFFLKYVNKDSGIHEVYLDEKKADLLESEGFKTYLEEHGKTAPKFFTTTALPLYRWSIAGTKTYAWLLSKVDVLKGTWSETGSSSKPWKSILIFIAFFIAILYDIAIKILNALMLSINTFTTLGFGEIPIKGLPRYLAIIQGFIGWFMLTIFSVSLISQLLN